MTTESPEIQRWDIRRVLKWTRGWFEGKGIETARLDAELLVAEALDVDRVRLYMDFERPLKAEELAQIRAYVARRGRREPVAYILRRRGFRELELFVDARVLVPRPETELLVDLALAAIAGIEAPVVVDVGTGSGAIALSIAHARPRAVVFATDPSAEALAVARANALAHGLDRVRLLEGALLAPIGEARPHLVVSNPPYIPSAELETLMPDVADHEPRLALDGGPDGLDVIRPLITDAAERLRPGGVLLLETGDDQGPTVADLCRADGRYAEPTLDADYDGHRRFVRASRP